MSTRADRIGAVFPNPDADIVGHNSVILRRFCENLHTTSSHVLDVGPVCRENISFLSERVKRLYLCDLFIRLEQHRRSQVPDQQFWRHLDYPDNLFDGVLLWDFGDRLDLNQLKELAAICHRIMRPDGLMVLLTLGRQNQNHDIHTFVLRDDFQLKLRPQSQLDLPPVYRPNNELLTALGDFTPLKSFIYRNGLREFLFQPRND